MCDLGWGQTICQRCTMHLVKMEKRMDVRTVEKLKDGILARGSYDIALDIDAERRSV